LLLAGFTAEGFGVLTQVFGKREEFLRALTGSGIDD